MENSKQVINSIIPMTLIITYINTGMDSEYAQRFFKAWSVSLPIAIITSLVVGPPTKKFVDKITN